MNIQNFAIIRSDIICMQKIKKAEPQKAVPPEWSCEKLAVLLNVWSTGILHVRRADRIFYALSYERHESGGLHV